jgi:hypothetical protein
VAALVALFATLLLPAVAGAQTVDSVDDCDAIFGTVDGTDFVDDQGEIDLTGYLTVYNQSQAQVTATANSGFTICVAGLEVGSDLTVTLDGTVVLFNGPFNPNATIAGVNWDANLMAIASQLGNLSCGPHTLTAVGTLENGEAFNQTINFQITCPPPPVTGSTTGMIVGVGGMLVVLGAGMYFSARQRREALA